MQIHHTRRRFGASVILLALVVVAAGCSDASDGVADDKPTIVASTTIWGDVVSSLVGDAANVEVLMPLGADPHEFQLSSRQIADIQSADLVVVNGLGLEGGFIDAIETAEADGANVLEVASALDPIPFGDASVEQCDPEASHDAQGEGEAACDPHVWMDPLRVAIAVGLIVDRLEDLDVTVDWGAAEAEYLAEIEKADEQVEATLSSVPSPDRALVTNHDSLGYFADRYGFEIVATVIPGGSTLGAASSAEIAALVKTMTERDINVIFADTSSPTDLAAAVSDELGSDVTVVELFTGSLGGPDSGGETLVEMWLTNANRIAEALGS